MNHLAPAHEPPAPEVTLEAMRNAARARPAWDEDPELGFLARTGDDTVEFWPLPIPSAVWQMAPHPKRVLAQHLSILETPADAHERLVAETIRAATPSYLFGGYFRWESWAAPENQAEELHRRREAGGSIPRFKDLEGRREFRMYNVADSTGRNYMVHLQRGGEMNGVYDGDGQKGVSGGDVPDLLQRLTLAALRTEAPPAPGTPPAQDGEGRGER